MNKENKVITLVGLFVVLAVALIVFIDRKLSKPEEISLGDDGTTVFADIGHYGLEVAGNFNTKEETTEFVYSLPSSNPNITYNWLQVKNSVGNDITYNNFSGSYLHIDGKVKTMLFNYTSNLGSITNGKILIVFPNGNYTLENVTTSEGVIDITNKVDVNEADGYYYVSFIGFNNTIDLAWGIEAIYENPSLPLRTAELYKLNSTVTNSATVNFNLNLDKIKRFKIAGAISSYSDVETKAYAYLPDGGLYQFYEKTGNIFRGRDNVKFLKHIIDAERYPSRDVGGGLDLFSQELSVTDLGGDTISSFYFKNNSNTPVKILSFGITQDIYEANVKVDTKITSEDRFKTNDIVSISTNVKNNTSNDGVCAKTYNVNITSSVDTVLSNITNIKARYKEQNIVASYDTTDNVVRVHLDEFDCSSPVVLSYDATINESINDLSRLEGHNYKINTEAVANYYLIANNTSSYPGSKVTVTDSDTVTSLKRVIITANYLEKDSGLKLADSSIQELYYGDDYVTSPSDDVSDNYELVETPINYIGTRIQNDITVDYIYEIKKATVRTQYIDAETGFPLISDVVDRKEYGDSYTTVLEDIEDYQFDHSVGITQGTVKGDVIVTYYYVKKVGRVVVYHVDMETNENLEPPTIATYKYHENYTTSPKNIFLYYIYDSVEGIPNGEVTEEETTVTYKYRKKTAEIYVYHLIDGTNTSIAPREVIPTKWGEYYTTDVSIEVPNNYELKTKTDNYVGYVKENRVEVYYYYQKKDSNISTEITLEGTQEIMSSKEEVTYNISYNATLGDYIGNGNIIIVDTLPYRIDISASDLNNGVYNDTNKTITWNIPWENIDTYDGRDSNTINLSIVVVYKDLDATERLMTNKVSGKLVLDNNERIVEEQCKTDIEIPGSIVVHHNLVGTNESLFEDDMFEGLVGDKYISAAKYQEGYKLITDPQSQSHILKEELTEVVYEYEHIKYSITVNNQTPDKGEVFGNEDVYYGEDSTPYNIVIEANNGYEIETIVVDGIEIEITDKERMVLDNFIGVYENHIIDVTFTELEIPVPITGSNNYIWIIALSILSLIAFITVPRLFLNGKEN